MAGLVPSVDWLLYSAIRKEALLTSQIEGTQATLTDLFDDEAGQVLANTADVEEVTNYLRAFRWAQGQLRDPQGLPISVRLLCEAHRLLLDGARGAGKQPGELRRSQNWIGGARPGRAAFVPPPPDQVPGLLADMERRNAHPSIRKRLQTSGWQHPLVRPEMLRFYAVATHGEAWDQPSAEQLLARGAVAHNHFFGLPEAMRLRLAQALDTLDQILKKANDLVVYRIEALASIRMWHWELVSARYFLM